MSLITENSPKFLKLFKALLAIIKELIGFIVRSVSNKRDKIKDGAVHGITVSCVTNTDNDDDSIPLDIYLSKLKG